MNQKKNKRSLGTALVEDYCKINKVGKVFKVFKELKDIYGLLLSLPPTPS